MKTSEPRNLIHVELLGPGLVGRTYRNVSKSTYDRHWRSLRLDPEFVKALCGGRWPDCGGANFDAAVRWKLDRRRRALVPLDKFGYECPLPDLQLRPINTWRTC